MIELKPWEEICDQCGGAGVKEKTVLVGEEGMQLEMDAPFYCWCCNGEGKVVKDGHEMYALTTINVNPKQ